LESTEADVVYESRARMQVSLLVSGAMMALGSLPWLGITLLQMAGGWWEGSWADKLALIVVPVCGLQGWVYVITYLRCIRRITVTREAISARMPFWGPKPGRWPLAEIVRARTVYYDSRWFWSIRRRRRAMGMRCWHAANADQQWSGYALVLSLNDGWDQFIITSDAWSLCQALGAAGVPIEPEIARCV
jgi:hypothetical protein